ncbi:Alpha/Beta hydrolase protein [Powellomyces hirtus]|nr:Alpha/Beta hydrolase protein [Powellomyces hirtus]
MAAEIATGESRPELPPAVQTTFTRSPSPTPSTSAIAPPIVTSAGPPSASSTNTPNGRLKRRLSGSGCFMTVHGTPCYMEKCSEKWLPYISPESYTTGNAVPNMGPRADSKRARTSSPPPSPRPLENPSVVDTAIECPSGTTVALRIWGDPTKTGPSRRVFCCHGWLDNAASFDRLAPRIAAAGACVVAIDAPGHGLSGWKSQNGGYYLWDLMDDILGVVDALEWETFTAIGHSTGGHILASFAGTFPTRITDLILLDSIGPAVQFTPANEAVEMASFIRRRRELNARGGTAGAGNEKRTRVYQTFEDAARARCRGFTAVSIDAARILCDRGMRPVYPTSTVGGGITGEVAYQWRTDPRLTLWGYLRTSENAIENVWRGITAQVLVCLGARSGLFSVTNDRHKRRLAALRDLTTRVMPDAGHHMHLESETVDAVAAECLTFLRW